MLTWPDESTSNADTENQWFHAGSNLVLDLHGDPAAGGVTLLSDGNHHMALNEVVKAFTAGDTTLRAPFYATFPPSVIALILRDGLLRCGNLVLTLVPGVLLGPPEFFSSIVDLVALESSKPFMQGRGSALLVCKGNPRNIHGVRDLLYGDARLFISNPRTEKVSYNAYADTLDEVTGAADSAGNWSSRMQGRIEYGVCIHHREAPTAVAEGRADAAILYYHLALRYCRVFPDLFEMAPLIDGATAGEPLPFERPSLINAALVAGFDDQALALYRFLDSDLVSAIYGHHGLDRATAA